MTYKELRDFINELSDDQLNMDVAVYLNEEICGGYFDVDTIAIADSDEGNDYMLPDQPYIVI